MTEHTTTAPPAAGAPTAVPPVHVTVDVSVAPDVAFRSFTADFDRWWPRSHHVGTSELAEAVLEPRAGGRWYEVGADGSECEWGSVLEWDPPRALTLAWQLDGTYRYEPDVNLASRVRVTFTASEAGGTRVELVHSEFERHAAGAGAVHRSVSGEGGWPLILGQLYRSCADPAS